MSRNTAEAKLWLYVIQSKQKFMNILQKHYILCLTILSKDYKLFIIQLGENLFTFSGFMKVRFSFTVSNA